MEPSDILALPGATWQEEYLEDTSLRRLILDYYDREHLAIRRYLLFLGVDVETAREIVQETFLRLHEHLLKRGDRQNLRAWLYRVAHNLARNAQAAFSASKTDSLPDLSLAKGLPAELPSAEEDLLAAERTALVRQAIAQLTAPQRECLVLRAQGFKYREIADVLSISVSTVGEHVQRAVEKLKELL